MKDKGILDFNQMFGLLPLINNPHNKMIKKFSLQIFEFFEKFQ